MYSQNLKKKAFETFWSHAHIIIIVLYLGFKAVFKCLKKQSEPVNEKWFLTAKILSLSTLKSLLKNSLFAYCFGSETTFVKFQRHSKIYSDAIDMELTSQIVFLIQAIFII